MMINQCKVITKTDSLQRKIEALNNFPLTENQLKFKIKEEKIFHSRKNILNAMSVGASMPNIKKLPT